MVVTNWSIKHGVTVFVLIVVLTMAGLLSYQNLPREAAPDITIPYVMVTTPYYGVAPSDIETLVTNPIEEELEQLKDVEEIRSTSAEGASIISIEFAPSIDIDTALQNVRERVDSAQPELPADAEDPIITEISFSEFPIMMVNISGEVGLGHLKEIAERLQDDLEGISGVLEVALVGGLEREINIEADPDLLEFYRVSLGELVSTIQSSNLNTPGGSVDVGEMQFLVRVPAEFESAAELEDLIIREEDGYPIRVRDVATVVDGFEEQATYSRLSGVESVSLSITRRAGENIIRITDEAKAIIDRYTIEYDDLVSFTVLADVSDDIRMQVGELENNILTGLILVAVVLLFFMGGLRNALFVAFAIPMSMLISFSLLAALGITLNIVVLFSLVLALGMLVDNAIVIVENIYRHVSMGKTRVQASMDGTAEVAWPVIASTATTVGAFLPMMFWPGIMGEFMKFLPLTVIIVLSSSLFVALIINPVLCSVMIRIPKQAQEAEGEVDELEALPKNFIYKIYGATLRFAVGHRAVVLVIVALTFFGTFAAFSKTDNGVELFPSTTPEVFYVNVSLPDGSNVEASDRVVRYIERFLGEQENILHFVADVGAGNGSQMDFGAGGTAPHRSQITVELLAADDQVEDPYVTIDRIRQFAHDIPGARVEIVAEEGGPPSGPPVNIELVGEDRDALAELAGVISRQIRDVPGLVNLQDDYEAGRTEVTVQVDRDVVSDYGLTAWDVADTVRTAINGTEA
ncbi:MAG: efflux RND transporter permease subunit, partial [Phycisphaerales bacterium]|nr:efflux RND transporter permease subunit [Phycisphaerales bacterium]